MGYFVQLLVQVNDGCAVCAAWQCSCGITAHTSSLLSCGVHAIGTVMMYMPYLASLLKHKCKTSPCQEWLIQTDRQTDRQTCMETRVQVRYLIAVRPLSQAGSIACPEAAIGCCHKLAEVASITACLLTEHLACQTRTMNTQPGSWTLDTELA